MSITKSSLIPDPWLLFELLQRKRYQRIQRHEERGQTRQWFLLCGPAPKETLLDPHPEKLRKLMPPIDRIWADPFLWKHGNDWFIVCEEWVFDKPHGHITALLLSPDGQAVSSSQPALVKDHHLSYPFLFEHEGVLHMMPEGGTGRAIEVYQCEEFPGRWRKRATLMRDLRYADATLFEHRAKWWLFVTIRRGLFGLNRDLFLFWADTPLTDKWKPHPCNPIVRGFKRARPAGRVFVVGGRLFRPSQNSLVRYGYGLNINEILQLDAKHYHERLVTEVRPDWEVGIRANHHIDWRDGMVVMDAQRLLPAPGISK
ncbi:MAG: hypothetical protein NT154_14575 [Verrucomicrobia bacterium]|nr:hypothetical protein [Verrucomicrobiota bacterium]